MSIIIVAAIGLSVWREHNPAKYCDELIQKNIESYKPVVCRLRYPILNIQEIRQLKDENEQLKEKILDLEYKLKNIDSAANNEEEITGPELMQIDY